MKKISAKSMLSFMTASAIVVTMAGSYAVWDKLEATQTATLTLDKPVEVSIVKPEDFKAVGTRTLGTKRNYSTDVTFNVANVDTYTGLAAEFKPTVKSGETDVTDKFTITIKEDGTDLTDFKDTDLEEVNNYTVEIIPITDDVTTTELANGALTVEIKGVLSGEITPVPAP